MRERPSEPDAVDRWLREGLEPDPRAAERIARRALGDMPAVSRSRASWRWALLAAAVLVAGVAVPIWWLDDSAPAAAREPIRITNSGEIITAVDPGVDVWLHAPERWVDPAAPRLIITLGGNHDR